MCASSVTWVQIFWLFLGIVYYYFSRSEIHTKLYIIIPYYSLPCSSTKWDYHLLSALAIAQPLRCLPYMQYEEQCFQTDEIIMEGVWVWYVEEWGYRVDQNMHGSWRGVIGEQTLSWESMGQPFSITPCAISMPSCLAARWRHVKPSYNGVWDEFTSWLTKHTFSFVRIFDGMNHTIKHPLPSDKHSVCQHSAFDFSLACF